MSTLVNIETPSPAMDLDAHICALIKDDSKRTSGKSKNNKKAIMKIFKPYSPPSTGIADTTNADHGVDRSKEISSVVPAAVGLMARVLVDSGMGAEQHAQDCIKPTGFVSSSKSSLPNAEHLALLRRKHMYSRCSNPL